jgi:protein TonB
VTVAEQKPNRKILVLGGAVAAAVMVNMGLLLLIGALISEKHRELAQLPKLQPVDFVRIRPKPLELPPSPAETKTVVETEAGTSRPPAQSKTAASGKAAPAPKRRSSKAGITAKNQSKLPGVAAPRLDIPAQGDGVAFAPVPGADERLTAPPAQWNIEKQPTTNGGTTGEGDGEGSGGDVSKTGLVVVSKVLPDYPRRARAQRIQGWVKLLITVTPSGRVSTAKVVDADPKGIFDEAALEAIKHWRFQPAYRNGQAIEQRAHQIIRFRLKQN